MKIIFQIRKIMPLGPFPTEQKSLYVWEYKNFTTPDRKNPMYVPISPAAYAAQVKKL